MAEYYDTPGTQSGLPKYYGNWDANYWVVAPTPDSTYLITLAYIKTTNFYNRFFWKHSRYLCK